jgi:uncharacterized Zn finger protein
MFVVTDNLKLRNAKQKAYEERPDVITDSLGSYRVEGSGSNYYNVSVAPIGHRLTVHCECTAGMYGNECYHAAAALETYEAEQARVAATKPPARDSRLALVARRLDYIVRNASTLAAVRFDVADQIENAARGALHALGEYEESMNAAPASTSSVA